MRGLQSQKFEDGHREISRRSPTLSDVCTLYWGRQSDIILLTFWVAHVACSASHGIDD